MIFLKYLTAYAAGILACIVITPVELLLINLHVWIIYPLALIGFPFYVLYLNPSYTFGSSSIHWIVGSLGLVPIILELIFFLNANARLKKWRPLWIGFPIGFIGTLGLYYSIAASV